VHKDEKRVIDSNGLIASRLQKLNEAPAPVFGYEDEEESGDFEGFHAGLNAEQLDMLLGDNTVGHPDVSEGNAADADYGYEGDGSPEADEEALERMQQDAGGFIEAAREEAERILASANEEAESIREAAREKGYSEGYEQGNTEVHKLISGKERELSEKEAQLQEEYEKKISEIEPLLVDTITDIFEHIFHVSLSSNREIMLNLLHDTVRNIEGGKNFIVHVSKDDFEYISDRKDQLTEGLGSTDTIEVIEDLTLRQSECFIESEGGIYDCGIGTELELLKKELMLLSYQKN
jgi:flagellar assembly protein FliH